MADRKKSAGNVRNPVKPKRPPTTNVARSKTTRAPITSKISTKLVYPDLRPYYRKISYGRFMRQILCEWFLDEKIKWAVNQMELDLALVGDELRKIRRQYCKTINRLKEIAFVVEQKRLLDIKNYDCKQFHEITDNSIAETTLKDLSTAIQLIINKIELSNVDFGYNETSGHQQLLDAVNDAIEGLANIIKESDLDMQKFQEYEHCKETIEELERNTFELECLKSEFEEKFPKLSQRLIQDFSENLAKLLKNLQC